MSKKHKLEWIYTTLCHYLLYCTDAKLGH